VFVWSRSLGLRVASPESRQLSLSGDSGSRGNEA
jgi:hypothetical protein